MGIEDCGENGVANNCPATGASRTVNQGTPSNMSAS